MTSAAEFAERFEQQAKAAETLACRPRWEQAEDFQFRSRQMRTLVLLMARAGFRLHPWQFFAFAAALAVDKEGRYLHDVVAIMVGRQQGKTLMAHGRSALALACGEVGVYTAQDRGKGSKRWKEAMRQVWLPVFGGALSAWYGNGTEHARLERTGGEISVFTPTVDGTRGDALDLVMLDEAYRHPLELQGAILPTMLTKQDPQLWLLSNAGDHQSTLLKHYRDLGREGAPKMCWLEWAAEEGADPADPKVWATCMPSLEVPGGVTLERVQANYDQTHAEAWDRENLNRWSLNETGAGMVDMVRWAQQSAPLVIHDDQTMCLGVAVNRDRDFAAIVGASVKEGVLLIEVAEVGEGPTTWVAAEVESLSKKMRCPVAIDSGSPAGTVATELIVKGVEVIDVSRRNVARASAMLEDRLLAGTLTHVEHPDLSAAAAVASKRRLGGGENWAWADPPAVEGEKQVSVATLEAATMAAFGALSEKRRSGPNVYDPTTLVDDEDVSEAWWGEEQAGEEDAEAV